MTEPSELRAALAGRSPREQARVVAAIAQRLRDAIAAGGESSAEADDAIALIGRWLAGERVSGPSLSDAVYTEDGRGVLRRLTDAPGQASADLWNALTTAVMYVAWIVYADNGERMPEDVSEVDEETLDLLDTQWRATATYDPAVFGG